MSRCYGVHSTSLTVSDSLSADTSGVNALASIRLQHSPSVLETNLEELDRQEMIEAVLTYDDEPDETQSTEAFLAQLKELEARWKSLPPEAFRG